MKTDHEAPFIGQTFTRGPARGEASHSFRPRRSSRATLPALAAGGLVLLLGWGCEDSTEALKAKQIAERCNLNSDCVQPYACVFQHCHVACRADVDCPDNRRCVHVPAEELEGDEKLPAGSTELFVCQLPEEVSCAADATACQGDQICASDLQCRDTCKTRIDCTPTQLCTTLGECVSSLPAVDRLDEHDNLLGAVPGHGSEGGTGGAAGSPSQTSGQSGSGGDDTSPARGGTEGGSTPAQPNSGGNTSHGGNGSTGSGGLTSASGEGGAGASLGAPGEGGSAGSETTSPEGYVESSDGIEPQPNDDRDHPVELTGAARIFLEPSDEDWFAVRAPADGRAHVIELSLAQAHGLSTIVSIYAAADDYRLGWESLGAGVTSTFYASVGPGTVTHFQFAGSVGTGFADISYRISDEQDGYEPNNSRQESASIATNTDISGQMLIPFVQANDRVADDWYLVELGPAPASLRLLANPSNGNLKITRYDPDRAPVDLMSNLFKPGQLGTFDMKVTTPGIYLLQVTMTNIQPFALGTKPSNYAEQYTFRVEQPTN